MATGNAAFLKLVHSPFRFKVFLISRLPAAWLAGLRVKAYTGDSCTITVRYKWLTQNPFRSVYFACLSMAAEMSTGILCMARVYRHQPPISMLVTGLKADFVKKATGVIAFTCADGPAIDVAIRRAVETGEGQELTVISTGINEQQETVATFLITWSFRVKRS